MTGHGAEPRQSARMAGDNSEDGTMERETHENSFSAWLLAFRPPRPRSRCAAVHPALRRSADVTASTPMSRRNSASRPAAAMASGATPLDRR